MKSIQQHITERLQLNKDRVRKIEYKYFPKTKSELSEIINELSENVSKNDIIDLNIIDTSQITDMSDLFYETTHNYDISQWNVSNVTDMTDMFYRSNFNNDISQWDVSHVYSMLSMFERSIFNGDISQWDVSNVKDMRYMFYKSKFNQDISQWDVSNISKENIHGIFFDSPIDNNLPKWYFDKKRNK